MGLVGSGAKPNGWRFGGLVVRIGALVACREGVARWKARGPEVRTSTEERL